MKKAIPLLGAALVMSALLASTASADVKKGQKAYLKTCKKCHGNGTKGAAMKTQPEWKKAFENDAAVFKAWHQNDPEANKMTESRKFKKLAPHLLDFLYEYGSDSGNIPACG